MPEQKTRIRQSDVKFRGNVRQVVSTISVTTDRETRPFTEPTSIAVTSQTAAVVPSGQQ